jgi:hypothetical protein
MTPIQKWPLIKRPLNLAEVLQLRNGIEISQKTHSGSTSEKILKRSRSDGWAMFSLN